MDQWAAETNDLRQQEQRVIVDVLIGLLSTQLLGSDVGEPPSAPQRRRSLERLVGQRGGPELQEHQHRRAALIDREERLDGVHADRNATFSEPRSYNRSSPRWSFPQPSSSHRIQEPDEANEPATSKG